MRFTGQGQGQQHDVGAGDWLLSEAVGAQDDATTTSPRSTADAASASVERDATASMEAPAT